MGCCGGTETRENKNYKAEVKGTEVPIIDDEAKANQNIENAKQNAEQQAKNEVVEPVTIKIEDTKKNEENDKNKAKETVNKEKKDTFNEEALAYHNELRAKHGCPPLKLNEKLCTIAQNYANELAAKNALQHSTNQYNDEPLGENLYYCSGFDVDPKTMTQSWYDEIQKYDFSSNNFIKGTGHFTQVIWKSTTDVGFGRSKSRSGAYYGVANYYKAGNFQGEFLKNVPKPK
jgi:uncharacterized protein YkwD